ncbi:MAG: DUF3500 domain-containing protein [Acidobacteriota bacterium]|nr:DUF3500 domain-containing protein [Acidobacteriota bacterium]
MKVQIRIVIGVFALFIAIVGFGLKSFSQQQSPAERVKQFAQRSLDAEKAGLAQPFKGVTTDGNVVPNLFAIKSTGVSTAPVRKAADTFLAALTPEQKTKTLFTVNDDEWRKWMNQHFYVRQGTGFIDMTEAQKQAALGLMRAALSAKGLKLSQDIMKLNHTLGELNNDNFIEYGEGRYYFTVMGKPSDKQPWGWQLDGHHLIINYFVLGDQVVMTPTFWGSEPIIAHAGKYKGVSILQEEQNNGLAMINALTEDQRKKAILSSSKTSNLNVGEAYKDNVVLDYKGIRGSELTAKQKEQLLGLAGLYISNMDAGHAKVKMSEIRQHLDNTWFSWVGETAKDSVFYYRIHSPVILIEFDHQTPAGLRHLSDPRKPNHEHIHTVVRTPNGNDYGKDLLRQHYQQHPHTK